MASLYYLKNESAVASEVGIDTARDSANLGGEFVDDAFRFGKQPFQAGDDWTGIQSRGRQNSNFAGNRKDFLNDFSASRNASKAVLTEFFPTRR